jgi:ribonuclease J
MYFNFPTEYADPRKMPNLKVYLKREGDLLYSKADYDKYSMGYLHFHGRNIAQDDRNIVRVAERLGVGGNPNNPKNPLPKTSEQEPYDYQELFELATHHLDNGVRAYQIRQTPRKYVFMFSYWDANELFDLIPLDTKEKTRYISASTEPFSEEMEIDESKMVNWLDFFNINYDYEIREKQKFFVRRHVSGHASKNELKELIDKINPKRIIPIHTTHQKLFEDMFPGRIILPKYAKPIEV